MIFHIALRYLLAKKSHKVVNVISLISIAGVAVATTAIVVVLSVFNGFSDLARKQLSAIDPDIKIVPTEAKVFAGADSLANILQNMPEVACAMPVLQERALVAGQNAQTPIIIKGVDPVRIGEMVDLDALLIDGVYSGTGGPVDSLPGIQLSVGVAVATGMRPSPDTKATIYMPRRLGRINPANPAAAYRELTSTVTGVFRIDQPEYDTEFVLAPLNKIRSLLEYGQGEASAIEVKAAPGTSPEKLAGILADKLPEELSILGREQQQAETFRMIAVEKWVTFLMLVFILVIASFNIVSTLSLLVIEKRRNMSTLRALGATKRMVSGIFVTLGWLITAAGGLIGISIGIILSLGQEYFGFIKLAGDPSALTIDVYPVHLEWPDIAAVLAAVLIVGFCMAQTSRLFTRRLDTASKV